MGEVLAVQAQGPEFGSLAGPTQNAGCSAIPHLTRGRQSILKALELLSPRFNKGPVSENSVETDGKSSLINL